MRALSSTRDVRSAMCALARVSSDVVVEILSYLDNIESVLQVGGACASLRRMTSLDSAWKPRLRTCWPGRFDVDAGALAQLATLEVDPRRLCLQCLPWRPRRGTGPDGASTWQSAFSWRPPWIMPESLHQPASSGDWFFVEIYESNTSYNDSVDRRLPDHLRVSMPENRGIDFLYGLVARKVVRLEECDVDGFPNVHVPLNIDLNKHVDGTNASPLFEVRVFMQLDGILVPLADTCCMIKGCGVGHGYHYTNRWINETERLFVAVQQAYVDVNRDDDTALTSVMESIEISWYFHENTVSHDGKLGAGKQALRDFHKQNSAQVISAIDDFDFEKFGDNSYYFACDYERDRRNPSLFDFMRKSADAPPRDPGPPMWEIPPPREAPRRFTRAG